MTPNIRSGSRKDLSARIADLQARLDETEETLRALRCGEVDAIVAAGPEGDRVYTLRGGDEAYRIMVEEMTEGALTLTSDGLILFSNEHFAAMLRRPLERVMGKRLQEFVAPEDADLVSALMKSLGSRKAEIRLRTEGEDSIPAFLSMQNVLLSGAACRCVIVTDLSEQKRHAEIAAVLEAVPTGVFIARDPACLDIVGNAAAYELLRFPDTRNVSASAFALERARRWRKVKDGVDLPLTDLPMQVAARTGKRVRDFEFDVFFDDGVCRTWVVNAVPLFDETGRPRGAVGAVTDITERKRSEEALEAANVELRNFGNALTQDLREPLSMVVKFTKLLATEYGTQLDKHAETCISNSLQGAFKIEALLNALLDYWSVIERNGLERSSVDCNEVLEQALQHLTISIQKSGSAVTFDALPTVAAENRLLRQVFEILIHNAIQYRGEAAPQIHISAVNAADRWLFSVRDNGIGIDPKNFEQIFGMFHRLHGNEIPGTGIGLALCRKIVERHGGRIWVESAAGSGAAFRFTLPVSLDPVLQGFVNLA